MDEVASGALPIDRLMTGRVTMENAVADGFERLLDPAGDAIKILVEVGSGSGRPG
jgi:(R,R)-butanediol dehydrogenase/meso-butanediol dehydrogenase/diacetyl reductase